MKKASCLLSYKGFFFVVITTLFLFFFCSSKVLAISFSIQNPTYDGDEIQVDVSLSGLTSSSCPNSICYLQGALSIPDQIKYFGLIKNEKGNWFSYTGSPDTSFIQSNFYTITSSGGNWSGSIRFKADPSNTNYNGPGTYVLKLWRYTGNSSNFAGEPSNTLTVSLLGPTLTPTVTPTFTPSPTPTNVPTPTKTPTPIPTSTPAKTPTPSPTSKLGSTPTVSVVVTNTVKATPSGEVLGSTTKSGSFTLPTPTPLEKPKSTVRVEGIQTQQDNTALFFIVGGLLLLCSCGILAFWPQIKALWKKE